MKTVGHSFSWSSDRQQKLLLKFPNSNWLKLLIFPVWIFAWLYKVVLYDARPDVINSKTRGQEWQALQSEWRFVHATFFYLGPPSHIIWHIKWPLMLNMTIAVIVTVDQIREYHNIPTFLPDVDTTVFNAFRLITFVMALLMAYRVNRTYDRWWQARQAFAGVGSAALMLSMQAGQWIQDPAVKAEIRRWCKIWHYSIMQICQGDQTISPSAAAWMTERELQNYQASRKGRNLVVTYLRRLIHRADAHVVERREMEKVLRAGTNASGTCIRLRFQCMPYSVTLIATGFLQIFLMFLPLAIISVTEPVHTGDHPAFGLIIHFCICLLMLGVDEVATQLEQPFPHIPMAEIVDSTVRDIDRLPNEMAAMSELQDEALQQQRVQLSKQAAAPAVHDDEVALADDIKALNKTSRDNNNTPALNLDTLEQQSSSAVGTGDAVIAVDST